MDKSQGSEKIRKISRAALIAALYVLLTILPPFYSFSYGPIQVRVAECLTVLPFLFPETIWGLGLGCFLANLVGGLGFYDFFLGTIFTIVAGYLTSRVPYPFLAPLPPVLINGFGVSIYLSLWFRVPYLYSVLYVMLGESIAAYGLGYPLLTFLLTKLKYYRKEHG
ncbi:MAG TPA: QueT transporter family protein [Candidatus Atribacteria bacterium]|nr:QueT transporter family protein [Candidatus Atribacteria bacterium]HPU08340.1 QueT transporter family protein [Candidatus Atribacteria bacterium]HQE24756.1 QueT transporter family protein [Candidatus Atribacteria bacterium]